MNTILASITLILILIALVLELARDLMMYQQNSYRPERYRRWLGESGDTTKIWRLAGIVILFISLSTLSHPVVALILVAIYAAFGINCLAKAKKKYKKPLVWTARARRIYAGELIVAAIVITVCYLLFGIGGIPSAALGTLALAALGCFCASHIILLAGATLLLPVDKAINRRYLNDARRRLRAMPDLRIIGITGSYGKTSTKHYLHRILSEKFETLMTPGSFNTTLGVVRTVREYLKPYHEVFIVEMGAKQLGDIKEICDLVQPTVGIVTAVGPQHLETFKSIENVQATKFELVDSLPADGVAVINEDFDMIAGRPVTNCRCLRYGVDNNKADYRAVDVRYTSRGTTFTIEGPEGYRLPLSTRLMGECNVSDLLAAAVAARQLGVPDSAIATAVAAIEPVEHRLSVKKTASGITILDDAYNSNPVGSRMALEVLGAMEGGQRIVITPGMIELGSEQHSLNRAFGEVIGRHADIAVIVGQYNREAILEGIAEAGRLAADNIITADTFAQAQTIVNTRAKAGDIILYENDLPDTFK